MIKATVVEDSLSPEEKRIVTLSLVYPRFIHAEVMTHRIFSRNAASSRAIPVKKFLEEIRTNPAMPIYWGKNQKGMQAAEELNEADKKVAESIVLQLRDLALVHVEKLAELGLHKQTANRYLEPWQHMATVVTFTEFENFENLRVHKDAQPELHDLAVHMCQCLEDHKPVELNPGEWHLPFVQEHERLTGGTHQLIKLSVARCARVSYKTHEGEIDPAKDAIRYWELLSSGHMSPFEHQATPAGKRDACSGNFEGWTQYRKLIPGEAVFRQDERSINARRRFAERDDPLWNTEGVVSGRL